MKKLFLIATMIVLTMSVTQAQKFAYVDSDYILENIPDYTTAQELLNTKSVEWQKEIEVKFAEVDKLYKAFQTDVVLLPEDMKKKRRDEIEKKEKEAKELQKKYFGKDGELAKKRAELVKPIQDKIYNAIEEYSNEKGIDIIFDKVSSSTGILFANAKLDKSDEILVKLGYKAGTTKTKEK